MKHLLGIGELERSQIEAILDSAESFVEVAGRSNPKVPALRGKSICNVFFEDSTRTRVSFELAGKLMSADVVNFSAGGSSVSKGESMRDTVETIAQMGFDVLVVRHRSSGVPWQMRKWCDASIINAGDGAHEHPTQALLDCLSLRQATGRKSFEGLRIAFIGDVANSRVVRSGIAAFSKLGAEIVLVAPHTMLPPSLDGWAVSEVSHDLDDTLPTVDVLYTIRPQLERVGSPLFPTVREYATRYGITAERGRRLRDDQLILEAGPLLRGVQMASDVADHPRNLMRRQVTNGVAVRMASYFLVLQGELDGDA